MKLHQLSLFLENKPGQLRPPCAALAEAGINIITLSLADTEQFGILRLIVRDWEKARTVLEKAGCVVKVTDVVAVEVPDHPGGLAALLDVFDRAHLNIEYMYAFTEKRGDKALMVFRIEDSDAALRVLQASGVNAAAAVDLLNRT
jgi:hypothetical protein